MYDTLLILFLLLLGFSVIALMLVNDLFVLILITGLISVLTGIIYILFDAVDVALTEIAVGAGISTILFLITMSLTKAYHIDGYNPIQRFSRIAPVNLINAGLLLVVFLLILDALSYAPIFGNMDTPANSSIIYKVYTKTSYETFDVQNSVTMILGAFRGYDTLGEAIVILTGAIGTYLVMQIDKLEKSEEISENTSSKNETPKDYVISATIFTLMPILLLFAFYIQFHGDFGPGGGFQSGVMIAASYFLIILYFGKTIANKFIDIKYLVFLAALGVLIFSITGLVGMLLGGKYLDYSVLASNTSSGYHLGLFSIELGVGTTVFAATAIIISQFYGKLKN
ncbi:MAG: Na(+)/H(+) antiporter subunit B [Alphaproteobacteria bacterium]|jgi:multicomponent Na+:H+ antiporter subunit B|nr:Na(+)/H(+) antiporter subunit B [Alphaproteobacteria bacterium]